MPEEEPTAMEIMLNLHSDHPQKGHHGNRGNPPTRRRRKRRGATPRRDTQRGDTPMRKRNKSNIKIFLAIELLEKDHVKLVNKIINSKNPVITAYFLKLMKIIDEELCQELELAIDRVVSLSGELVPVDAVDSSTDNDNVVKLILQDVMALLESKYSNMTWRKLEKHGLTLGEGRTLRTIAADEITVWKIFRDGRRIPVGLIDDRKAELILKEISSLRRHWIVSTDSDLALITNRLAAAVFDAAISGKITVNDNAVYIDEHGIKYGPQWLSGKPLPELVKQGLKLLNKLREFFDKEPLAIAVKAGLTAWLSRQMRRRGGLVPIVMYYGFPGTGKTTLATVASLIAGRNSPITVSAETEARIAGAYEEGGVVIIDEAETALSKSEVVDVIKRGATSEVCRVIKNTNGEDKPQYANSILILTLNKNPVTSVNDGLLRRSVISRLTKIPTDKDRKKLQQLWPEMEELLPQISRYIISELSEKIIEFIKNKSSKVRSDELFNVTANFILDYLMNEFNIDLQWIKDVEVVPRIERNVDIEEEVRHELIKFSVRNRCSDVSEFCRKAGIIVKSGIAIITEKACQELGVLPEALELALKRIGGKKAKVRRGPQVIPAIVIEQEKLAKWLQFEEDEEDEVWDIEIIEFEDDDDDNENSSNTNISNKPNNDDENDNEREEHEESTEERDKDNNESSSITKEDVKKALAKLQGTNEHDYGIPSSEIAKELGTNQETVEKLLQELAASGEVIIAPYGYKLPYTNTSTSSKEEQETTNSEVSDSKKSIKQVLKEVIKNMDSGEWITPIGILKKAIHEYNMPASIIAEHVETAKEVIKWAREKGLVTTDEWGDLIRS